MKRFMPVMVLITTLLGVVSTSAWALRFPIQGARGRAMGGAGVAGIDDENGYNWNPANSSIRKRSFDMGIHASGQLQSTKDIQKEIQDLQDFEENVAPLDSITSSDYSDTTAYVRFMRLTGELTEVNQNGQGLLANVMGGFNARQGGLGFISGGSLGLIANNRTSFSVSNDLDLDEVLIGGSGADSATTRQFITGDSSATSAGGNTIDRSRISRQTEDVLQNEISESLNARGLDPQADLGFSAGVGASDLANEVAFRIQQADPDGDTITEQKIRSAAKVLLPGVIAAADSDASDFDTEDQKIVAQGISLTEIGVSYTHGSPVVTLFGGGLYAGGNLKYMRGKVGYKEYPVFQERDEEDAFDDNTTTSSDFGVDLGLLYDQMDTYGFRVGLVGKNLNTPSFDYPASADTAGLDEFEIDPQVRMGLAAHPLRMIPGNGVGQDWWKMTVDYDVTSNETSLPGYESQYIAVGNEFNLYNRPWLNLAFRTGLRSNLEQGQEGTVYSGGLGLKLGYVNIDLSGTVSDKQVKDEEGNKRPTVMGGAFNLAFRF